jgi:hypothetical protein
MPGKRWRLGEYELFTADSTMPARHFLEYDRVERASAGAILRRCLDRAAYHLTVIDICKTLRLSYTDVSEARLSDEIARALNTGKLYLLRRRSGGSSDKAAEEPPQPKKEPAKALPPEKTKTWIEIHLVDQNDQPVGDVRYQLKITDGSMRTGTLGADGVLRVPGIDPGTCEISFPDIDASEWRPA